MFYIGSHFGKEIYKVLLLTVILIGSLDLNLSPLNSLDLIGQFIDEILYNFGLLL